MQSPNAPYLRGLDHLRAIAAVLVVFHHSWVNVGGRLAHGTAERYQRPALSPIDAFLQEGHTGVALFMVLSGFIFTRIAYGREVRYWPFLANRVLRIYPLMLFVFIIGWLVRPALAEPLDLVRLLFIPFALAHPVDFWFVPEIYPFTTLFWAIVTEFKFYLLFPLLLALLHRDGLRVLVIMILGAITLRILLIADGAEPAGLTYYTIFGRIDQFLVGMAAAVLHQPGRLRRPGRLAGSALVTMAFLLLALSHIPRGSGAETAWRIFWPTVEGSVWAVFIIGYLDWSERLRPHLSAVLALIGQISFSIYLLHMAVVASLLKLGPLSFGLGPGPDAILNAILYILPVTLALSWVTFHLIEEPFLRRRMRYLGATLGKPAVSPGSSPGPTPEFKLKTP